MKRPVRGPCAPRLWLALAFIAGPTAAPALAQDLPPGEDALPSAVAGTDRLPRLLEALRGADSFKVRATAAVALGRIGDPRAAQALAVSLRDDRHYAVRAAAASALGRLNAAEGVPALLHALDDDDEFVKNEALQALDRFHGPEHLFAFRDALTSQDAEKRLAAVRAYGDVLRAGQESAAPFVVEALGDESEEVVAVAERALAEVPHDRAVPLLLQGLDGGSPGVREATARMLGRRIDERAVTPLFSIASSTTESEPVRLAAREALRKHREYVDVAAALKAASETSPAAREQRIDALRLLGALGEPTVFDSLAVALNDRDPQVRLAAARAAVDLGGNRGRALLESARDRETDERAQRQLELLLKILK